MSYGNNRHRSGPRLGISIRELAVAFVVGAIIVATMFSILRSNRSRNIEFANPAEASSHEALNETEIAVECTSGEAATDPIIYQLYIQSNPCGSNDNSNDAGALIIPDDFPFDDETPARWKYIVLHHSGSTNDTLEGIRSWHVDHNGWKDIGYHFVVLPDGEIWTTERWRRQWDGAHCKTRNTDGIGVCLIGDFRASPPPDTQRRAAASLVTSLCQHYGIAANRVIRHRDEAATECPGRITWREIIGTYAAVTDHDATSHNE